MNFFQQQKRPKILKRYCITIGKTGSFWNVKSTVDPSDNLQINNEFN